MSRVSEVPESILPPEAVAALDAQLAGGLDERLRGELDEVYEKLKMVITAGLEAKRRVRVERACSKCGCSHIDYVEIEDVKSAIQAAEFYANRTEGRAAASRGVEAEAGVSFTRTVVYGAVSSSEVDSDG